MQHEQELPLIHDRLPLAVFIRDQLDAAGRLPDTATALPDEVPRNPGEISFAPGALDGIMGHHGGSDPDSSQAEEIADLVLGAAADPTPQHLGQLYEAINTDAALGLVDPLIQALVAKGASSLAVAQIGSWLASTAPDRGPVKVGIALLGVSGAPDGELLHVLGAHDEFTLFVAVAFGNSRSDPEPDLYELAQRVDGWGRIHCVERLSGSTDPTVTKWILREGFRNAVMYEYLAYIAATTGDLAASLDIANPDRELLTAAADIIGALIAGGPAEDIDDYADAPVALARWLDHMDHYGATVGDFITIRAIADFSAGDGWEDRISDGAWTAAARQAIGDHARTLLVDPRWPDIVRHGLNSTDATEFYSAVQAARALGIDAFGSLLDAIAADPLGGPWFQAWQDADATRTQTLVEYATRLLDLDAIASGPAQAIGMGPEFRPHMALGWTLQGLRDHRGVGATLVSAALQSPSIQNRSGAINVLEAWGPQFWTDEVRYHLAALAEGDPNDKVRARAGDVLALDTTE